MQDAIRNSSVERLSKIISDTRPENGGSGGVGKNRQRPTIHVHLGLEEGWFSLFLLAAVVYSTVWSVQAAGWVAHLDTLTLTTALGLVGGLIAAKQRRLPRIPIHLIVVTVGILLAFWQTAGAFYGGNTAQLVNGMHRWFTFVIVGGVGEDDSIFLFFITALGFVLAYTSAWLVYRTRSPWLVVVANAVVLLINLSYMSDGFIIFLVVFLMAALLLLLRFNLYESVKRWRRQGLRYADDLGWDVMQAGAIISIGILIFSWLLPFGYTNDALAQIWSANANPWVVLQNLWNRTVSLSGATTIANHGNFADTLTLAGNPNLTKTVVFNVTSNDPNQYLASLSYDNYDGRSWTISPTFSLTVPSSQLIPSQSSVVHSVTQHINVVNPPGEQNPYLLGASQIGSVDQPSQALVSKAGDSLVASLDTNGKLVAGEHYTVVSYVSSADETQLRGVPMPVYAPTLPPNFDGQFPLSYYDPAVLNTNTQLPQGLDPQIAALAKSITANAPTMYDKVVALENYFRSNYTYDVNIHPPADQEIVSWFLFHSDHRGFCNYFSTSMAVMARSLGIPARVVAGYTNGDFDQKKLQDVIYGTDAHSWTQIYFAGYGWINFEPSASFSSFARPLPGEFQTNTSGTNPTGGITNPKPGPHGKLGVNGSTDLGGKVPGQSAGQITLEVGQQVGLALGSIVLLILFGLIFFTLWWRRLFRNYRLPAQIFGRICMLASWAGVSLERSQTPYESIQVLAGATPGEAVTLERFGDIYVRELWADPKSVEHPRRSGEEKELPSLWKNLQPRLFLYVMRHPSFLRLLPARFGNYIKQLRTKRRTNRDLRDIEEDL